MTYHSLNPYEAISGHTTIFPVYAQHEGELCNNNRSTVDLCIRGVNSQ